MNHTNIINKIQEIEKIINYEKLIAVFMNMDNYFFLDFLHNDLNEQDVNQIVHEYFKVFSHDEFMSLIEEKTKYAIDLIIQSFKELSKRTNLYKEDYVELFNFDLLKNKILENNLSYFDKQTVNGNNYYIAS